MHKKDAIVLWCCLALLVLAYLLLPPPWAYYCAVGPIVLFCLFRFFTGRFPRG